MPNRDPHAGPVVYKLPTLDPKVYDSHYQVSFFGHGYADVVKVDGQYQTLVYYPGGKYRCTGGVHRKYKDAITSVTNLLQKHKVN